MPSDNAKKEGETPASPLVAMSQDQLQALLTAMQSSGQGGMDPTQFAEALAKANQKVNKPENSVSPGISVFNDRGERDHPKPALHVKMTCAGYPLEPSTLDREEVDLLNRLEPGRYMVSKADGAKIPFDVLPRFDSLARLDQFDLLFPCKTKDQRMGLLGLKPMLREIVTGQPESVRIEDLLAENARLRQLLPGLMG